MTPDELDAAKQVRNAGCVGMGCGCLLMVIGILIVFAVKLIG